MHHHHSTCRSRAVSARRIAAALLGAGLLAGACAEKTAPAPPPPPEVLVDRGRPDRTCRSRWSSWARRSGFQDVEIRARVEGFLDVVGFPEGTLVRKGEVLYRIDRKPLEASLANAQAELATAQARYEKTQNDVKRLRPLAAKQAVSAQELDNAVAFEDAARVAGGGAQGRRRDGVARSRLHERHLADRRARRHDAREGGQPRRTRREHAAHDGLADRPDPLPRRHQRGRVPPDRPARRRTARGARRPEDPHRPRARRRHGAPAQGLPRRRSSGPSTRRPAP